MTEEVARAILVEVLRQPVGFDEVVPEKAVRVAFDRGRVFESGAVPVEPFGFLDPVEERVTLLQEIGEAVDFDGFGLFSRRRPCGGIFGWPREGPRSSEEFFSPGPDLRRGSRR